MNLSLGSIENEATETSRSADLTWYFTAQSEGAASAPSPLVLSKQIQGINRLAS